MANSRNETPETFRQQANIIQQLSDQFAHLLDPDIIESVVVECNYDAAVSKEKFAELLGPDFMAEISQHQPAKSKEQQMEVSGSSASSTEVVTTPVEYAKQGYRVIILLRGLPGSGKSTLGKQLLNEIIGPFQPRDYIFSADDYFLRNGKYDFNQSDLREAHTWTQKLAKQALQRGKSPIFIDNTNTQMWEMRPYCEWAVEYGYQIFIEEPKTNWAFKVGELARRNTHRVPRDKIQDMMDRYEHGITPATVFQAYGLSYGPLRPPVMRNFPPLRELMSREIKEQPVESSKRDTMTSTGGQDGNKEQGKVLQGKGTFVNHGQLPSNYPKTGHFDKGTMTLEVEGQENLEGLSIEEVKDKALDYLLELFENIPRDYLEDVLLNCGGDVEWCITILSEDHQFLIDGYEPSKKVTTPQQPKASSTEGQEAITMIDLTEKPEVNDKIEVKPLTDQKTNMKKHLESNIFINPEHYGPNTSKLKGFTEVNGPNTSRLKGFTEVKPTDKPGTSQRTSNETQDDGFVLLETEESPCEDSSDVEDTTSEDSEGREEADTIEVNLGPELVRQLKLLFGDPEIPGFNSPTVEIPRELGKQLHALYYESMLKQVEAQQLQLQHMLAEDEEMQMKLQVEEIRKLEAGEEDVPSLRQIMKDQAEAQRHQKLVDSQWRHLSPKDMAFKMTVQKLEASFPKIPVETLTEIYHAHEGNFEETLFALRDSGGEYQENAKKTLSAGTLKEMQQAHDVSKQAQLQDQRHFEEGAAGGVERSSVELRAEAQEHQRRRDQLRNRAREYYNKGMTEVATFYSDLASDQTRMWEKYNSLATVQIVNEGFNRINDSDTIDLHFLHVPEALNALDIYIDEIINKLQTQQRTGKAKDIHVITGRGKNSPNGVPRIRPSVEQRLKKRKLRFNRVNPGLLKVKILKTSAVTAALRIN